MALSAVRQVIDLHRRQLAGLVEIKGIGRLLPHYERSRVDLERKLQRLVRAGRGQTFGAHQIRQVLAQVTSAVLEIQGSIAGNLAGGAEIARVLAPRHVLNAVEKLSEHFAGSTPVLQPRAVAALQGIRRATPPSLLDRFAVSSRLYGPPVIKKVRDQLTLSMLQNESVDEAVDRVAGVDGVMAAERWRAERIVRTETAHAYGYEKQESMRALAREVPKMQKRLVATIDDRTGEDSVELNGQTVDVDQPFIWRVRDSRGALTGKVIRYMQPPNRPNDREITIPWLASWPASPSLDGAGPVNPTTGGL